LAYCDGLCGDKLDGVSWRAVCPNDTCSGNLDGVLIDVNPAGNDENLGGIRIRSCSWIDHYRSHLNNRSLEDRDLPREPPAFFSQLESCPSPVLVYFPTDLLFLRFLCQEESCEKLEYLLRPILPLEGENN
jgi:hypothetical protein